MNASSKIDQAEAVVREVLARRGAPPTREAVDRTARHLQLDSTQQAELTQRFSVAIAADEVRAGMQGERSQRTGFVVGRLIRAALITFAGLTAALTALGIGVWVYEAAERDKRHKREAREKAAWEADAPARALREAAAKEEDRMEEEQRRRKKAISDLSLCAMSTGSTYTRGDVEAASTDSIEATLRACKKEQPLRWLDGTQ